MKIVVFCFFFQAEDGIRDHCVTGVQTCALPISVVARADGHQILAECDLRGVRRLRHGRRRGEHHAHAEQAGANSLGHPEGLLKVAGIIIRRMTARKILLTFGAAALTLGVTGMSQAATCESLASLTLPNTTITMAQPVAAGAFVAPGRGGGPGQPLTDVPAFCRVMATLTPSIDSDIRMELWLPVERSSTVAAGGGGWNGKLRGTGNGGLGGGTGANANALAGGVRRGYATAGNNTGHLGDSSYALSHPEQIKDFSYRSAHEMTVASKALIQAYYGRPAKIAYMAEGGGGTIAALSSAQRYPDDYDTIAVTGMSSYLTRHTFGQMWVWQATHQDAASYIPPDKYPALHHAALEARDALDGLKDGLIGDVPRSKFDPGV